mgnify:CR=1 FL=1|tara:strand:- start:3616 stop:5310 length:1695 start_codon:yes stop_codon:yes gene_type:complete
MAIIDEYYDIDFDPEVGAFKGLAGNFLTTRIKENKEKFARQLKAADPTLEGDILKEDMKILRELEKQYSELRSKPSGGGSVSYSFTGPNPKDYFTAEANRIEQQQKQANTYQKAASGVGRFDREIKDRLIKNIEGVDPNTQEGQQVIRGRVNQIVENWQGDRQYGSINRSKSGMHALGVGVLTQIDGLDPRTQRVVEASLRQNKAVPTSEDLRVYNDPTTISEKERARMEPLKRGQTSSRTTTPTMSQGLPIDTISASLLDRIAKQRARVQEGRLRYDRAVAEYRGLASGPDYNMALAPLTTRPTRLTDTLNMYGDLRRVDPRYARTALEASREAGTFTMPDRYVGLSAGESPIDSLVSMTDTLRAGIPGDTGSDNVADYTADEVTFVRDTLKSMKDLSSSPLLAGQSYGTIGEDKEQFSEYVSTRLELLDGMLNAGQGDSPAAAQAAKDFRDELLEWKELSEAEGVLETTRKATDPKELVSKSIGNVKGALREFEVDGDENKLSGILTEERNIARNAGSSNEYAAAFVEEVENFVKSGDPAYFDNSITELHIAINKPALEGGV